MFYKPTSKNNQSTYYSLNENVEHDFCDQIDETDFFEIMNNFKINLSDFLKNKNQINVENIKNFNKFILKCKLKLGINISDSLIYIEKKYVSFSKLINLLNEENKQILKKEMAEKYKIKIEKNNLKKFMVI